MILLIDKPKGMTSHDVIDHLRKVTGVKRIGHAGTLDPNATGLLIVAIGRESTKRLSGFLKKDKTYEAEIFLGEERDTDDVEGSVRENPFLKRVGKKVSSKEVESILKKFLGKQKQIPPSYSAIKINGKKAYQMARAGKDLSSKLKERSVMIYSIKVLFFKYPILKIEVKVSSGTYVRALARDIGRSLNTGAYLKNLKRTSIGKYKLADAIKLEDVKKSNLDESALEFV